MTKRGPHRHAGGTDFSANYVGTLGCLAFGSVSIVWWDFTSSTGSP